MSVNSGHAFDIRLLRVGVIRRRVDVMGVRVSGARRTEGLAGARSAVPHVSPPPGVEGRGAPAQRGVVKGQRHECSVRRTFEA